jgi:hypothetical protein
MSNTLGCVWGSWDACAAGEKLLVDKDIFIQKRMEKQYEISLMIIFLVLLGVQISIFL